MNEKDINCYVDEGHVRCEVDGRQTGMVDEDDIREAAESTTGSIAARESCADINEAILREYHHGEMRDEREGQLMLTTMTMGCPVPKLQDE